MKSMIVLIAMLLAASSVAAVNSFLVPEVASIEANDVVVVQYCVENPSGTPFPGVAVSVEQVCKDANGIVGCQDPPDDTSTTQLSVTALDAVTGLDGCADVQLTSSSASGTFYYTVAGSQANVEITRETGTAVVPEFGVMATAAALIAAGLMVWRKRQ